MAAARGCSRGAGRWFRRLLVLCSALMATYQCWTLLELYLSEPTATTITFPPWPEVEVPRVTVCARHPTRNFTAEEMPLSRALLDCTPGCAVPRDGVIQQGRNTYTKVSTGAWLTQEHGLDGRCYTMQPNVTWKHVTKMVPESKGHMTFCFQLKPDNETRDYGYIVIVHPKRQAIITQYGGDIQMDDKFYLKDRPTVRLTVSYNTFTRESLRASQVQCYRWLPPRHMHVGLLFLPLGEGKELLPPRDGRRLPRTLRHAHHQCGRAFGTPSILLNVDAFLVAEMSLSSANLLKRVKPLPHGRCAGAVGIELMAARVPEERLDERRTYPLVSLLSEMGGYISLMLGVSVVSLADLAAEVFGPKGDTRSVAAAAAAAGRRAAHHQDPALNRRQTRPELAAILP